MRIIGLVSLTFLGMLVLGRIAGRDALLWISVACNLIMFGLATRRWFAARIEADRRNNRS